MKLSPIRLTALVLLIALLCAPVLDAQDRAGDRGRPAVLTVKSSKLIAALESTIPRLMREGDVPGLSIALIRDSQVFWQRGFGVRNAATGEPVADSTVFEAASLSKPVFAYAVLKMVDRGQLDLDTPLNKYLPGAYVENDARLDLITARRVLTHTTGFPNWRPRGMPLKIHFTPGERFSYSGEGFVYLQKVVEHLSGLPLDDFMKKTVFEPLGMTSSSYVWLDKFDSLKATGHNAVGGATERRHPTEANAAASLQTTALDYTRFLIAVMNGTGLKRETSIQMLAPQIKVDEACSNCIGGRPSGKLSDSISWGLGVGLQRTDAGDAFWHWGDNGDVHCFMEAFPARRAAVVVFTDSANGLSIIPDIVRQAMGESQPALAWIKYESYRSPGRILLKDILARGAVPALERYRELRKSHAGTELVNEAGMNRIGYQLLEAKKVGDAIEVFRLNVLDYPGSSNVYDSLGEAYMAHGDKELAIKNYRRSVELDPNNTNGLAMLKKLEGK